MPDGTDKSPCAKFKGPTRSWCEDGEGLDRKFDKQREGGGQLTGGASDHVKDLANYLIRKIEGLIAPKDSWAPKEADSWIYQQFLWLGQHLAITIFICVVVVCALTAWQSSRLRQLGLSTGWTLAAVALMGAIPGAVTALNTAVSSGFQAMFDGGDSTLFGAIKDDLDKSADGGNPVAILIIVAALVVALGFALLVFMCRTPGIVVFVSLAPLVIATLARGGDMSAIQSWMNRLLGLMLCPFALILVSPFVEMIRGSLVMDAVLLLAADALMLRMIMHGVPYVGPRVAGAARRYVEGRTTNPVARAVVRAGAPDHYERENSPRVPRTVDTPGRAMTQDRGVLLAAYGVKQQQERPGRLTTASAVDKARREEGDRATRTAQISQARRQARPAAVPPQGPGTQGRAAPAGPQRPAPQTRGAQTPPAPRPAPPSSSNP
ncbi:hypothetical protein ACFYN3_40780 [Streptomyces lavendulae]|uniref:hypothetical protein n=1 Tax=Streptomyces lavendulae TaxID=1914 RepID=UPI0036C2DFDD